MTRLYKNTLKDDPTRTLTLRNKAVSETNRRYGELKSLVYATVATNNYFNINAVPLEGSDFVFLRDSERLDRFDIWLQQTIAELITSGNATPGSSEINWLLEYTETGYVRGVKKGNSQLSSQFGNNIVPDRIDIFAGPFHVEKASLLFSRDFTQLKGITAAMSQQMNYILSEGILNGENPEKIARKMLDRIDKIGITRTRLLARTEIINAHNLGTILEGEEVGDLLGEEIVYRWITAGDGKVRTSHAIRNSRYYTQEEVIKLIGEPNCRCSVVAVPLSRVPEGVRVIGLN